MELTVTISSLETLTTAQLKPFDTVYLGNPFCLRYPGNIIAGADSLRRAVRYCREAGVNPYVATPVVVEANDVETVETLLDVAKTEEAGVEITDVGLLGAAKTRGLPMHFGPFANIYNSRAASVFRAAGVRRFVPSPELTLDEVAALGKVAGADIEISVHGRQTLGIAGACPEQGRSSQSRAASQVAASNSCGGCRPRPTALDFGEMEVLLAGPATFTSGSLSMIEHLPLIAGRGIRCFRIDGLWHKAAELSRLGRAYRAALEEGTGPAGTATFAGENGDWFNGWYFGRSGRDYIGGLDLASRGQGHRARERPRGGADSG